MDDALRPHRKFPINLYLALCAAMVSGRIIGGIARVFFYTGTGESFTLAMWVSSNFVSALPGILCHLLVIPLPSDNHFEKDTADPSLTALRSFKWKRKISLHFFDRCAPWWDDDMIRDEDILTTIMTLGGIREGIDVLDVVCGTGVLFPDYLKRKVASVTGIDISPEVAKIAAASSPATFQTIPEEVSVIFENYTKEAPVNHASG